MHALSYDRLQQKPINNFWKSSRGHSQGLPKFFRASIYRAHRALYMDRALRGFLCDSMAFLLVLSSVCLSMCVCVTLVLCIPVSLPACAARNKGLYILKIILTYTSDFFSACFHTSYKLYNDVSYIVSTNLQCCLMSFSLQFTTHNRRHTCRLYT